MRMVKHAILSIGFLMAGPLAAQTTVVTFDNGGEGWDGNGLVEQDGGNPGANFHFFVNNSASRRATTRTPHSSAT